MNAVADYCDREDLNVCKRARENGDGERGDNQNRNSRDRLMVMQARGSLIAKNSVATLPSQKGAECQNGLCYRCESLSLRS